MSAPLLLSAHCEQESRCQPLSSDATQRPTAVKAQSLDITEDSMCGAGGQRSVHSHSSTDQSTRAGQFEKRTDEFTAALDA